MSYYHEWNDGEPITRTKINNIEKGVRQANSILNTLFVPTALAKSKNIFDGTQYEEYVVNTNDHDYTLHYGGYSTVAIEGSASRANSAYISLNQMELEQGKTYTMLAYTEDGRVNTPINLISTGHVDQYISFNTNNDVVIYTPENDIHNAYLNFWFDDNETHSLVPITGKYTILICEGEYTYDELVVRLNRFTDMYNSAYSHSLITNKALQTEIFEGTQYQNETATSDSGSIIHLSINGLHSVKINIQKLNANGTLYISRAMLNFKANTDYTMYVDTEDGPTDVGFGIFSNDETYTLAYPRQLHTFTIGNNNISNAFVTIWSPTLKSNIECTYYIYICEGNFTNKTFFGREFTDNEINGLQNSINDLQDAMLSSPLSNKILKANMFEGTQYTSQMTNNGVTNIRNGISGVELSGITFTDVPIWISKADMTFSSDTTYTMCVMSNNGNNDLYFYLIGDGGRVQSNGVNVGAKCNGAPVIFTPDETRTGVYVHLYTTSQIDVNGIYYIYICRGRFTQTDFTPDPDSELYIINLQEYEKTHFLLTHTARKVEMFGNTQYDYSYQPVNTNLTITKSDINGITLSGNLGGGAYISQAKMSFLEGKTYTACVITNDGLDGVAFYIVQGDNNTNDIQVNSNGSIVTFTPNITTLNSYVYVYESDSATQLDGTYYIYICEGTFTKEQLFAIIYEKEADDEQYVREEIARKNLFKATFLRYHSEQNGGDMIISKKGKSGLYLNGVARPGSGMWITGNYVSLDKTKKYTMAVISPNFAGKARLNVWIAGWDENNDWAQLQDTPADENATAENVSIYINDKVRVFQPNKDIFNAGFLIWTEDANTENNNKIEVTGAYYIYLVEGEYTNENFFNLNSPVQQIVPLLYRKTNIYDNDYYTGLPVLYLDGDFKNVTKEISKDISYFYRDRLTSYQGTGTVKWQGSSSLRYPKKNFTVKLNNSISFLEWGSRNKFVLKANYIDASHARNVCCAKLWGQIVKSRTAHSSDVTDTYLRDLPNGGAIDGFPIMLYINDSYAGLYTLNTSKDKKLFGINSNNEATACILSAEDHTYATSFRATTTKEQVFAGTTFGVEYVYDANGNDKYDEDEIEAAVDSLNYLLGLCNPSASMGDTYEYDEIADHIDIDSAIDYLLFTALIGGIDIWDKNYLLTTFDGTKWFMSAYDLDSVLGNHWTGTEYYAPNGYDELHDYPTCDYNYLTQDNNLFKIIKEQDEERIQNRFRKLTENYGPMSEENILTVFSNFLKDIPLNLRIKEGELWPHIPGTDTNNLAQIMNWYRLRLPIIRQQVLHSNT